MPLIGSLGAAASRGFGQFLQKISGAIGADAFFKYVTLLLTGSPPTSTFVTDASTNNLQVTINGDTKPNGFSPNENGYYSCYFDGTGDRILLSGSNLTLFGDFTVEAWVYIGSLATLRSILCIGDSRTSPGVLFAVSTTGKLIVFANNAAVLTGTGTSVVANTWTHVAFVRSGTTITGYVNGAVQGTATSSATFTGIASYIGFELYNSGLGAEFLGNISNLRVVDGTAVYTSAFTPSTTPLTAISGTALLACQANRFIDNSSSPKAMTVVGQTYIAGFQPFTPNPSFATYGSTFFDGSGDYLANSTSTALTFGTSAYTVEFWMYYQGATGGEYDIVEANPNYGSFQLYVASGSQGLKWGSYGLNSFAILNASSIPLNTWTHIVVSRVSTSSNQTFAFVNGVLVNTATDSNNYTGVGFGVGGRNNGSNYFTGYLSNVRIINGTALYTAAFTPPTTQLTAVTNTSLLTCQTNQPVNNNVFLDSSSNNFAITRVGNTTQGSLNPYGGNWSNYFDGSGDYLNCSASSAQFGTGDFTIECWVYPTSLAAIQVIVDFRTTSTAIFGQIYLATNGTVHFYLPTDIATTNTVTLNAWNHIAISRSAGTLKMFINGTSGYSAANSGTYNAVGTYIGISISNTNGFTGYISNMRFITGTGIYTSNFTPSTTPLTAIAKTSLLTCQSNRFIDNSNNNFTITKTGDVNTQRFSPFAPVIQTPISYSNFFNGSSDYLQIPNNVSNQMGTGDWTAEAWVYLTSYTLLNPIFAKGGTTTDWFIGTYPSTGRLYIGIGLTDYFATTGPVVPLFTWCHVALVRNGSDQTTYLNGVVGNTRTTAANYVSTGALNIGRGRDSSSSYLSGYVSNARIVKGTAVYTSNFTPPTTPLTAISGTQLLTCQSPTIVDNSPNASAISVFNNVRPFTQNPFGFTNNTNAPYTPATYSGSMYFDGTGDYLTFANNSAFAFGTGAFTIEFWINSPLLNDKFILGGRAAIGTMIITTGGSASTAGVLRYVGSSTIVSTNVITDNTWHHCAITRGVGNFVTLYVDGNFVASGTDTTNYTATTGTWYMGTQDTGVGIGTTNMLTGYISNLRIIKGTQLYTSSFAPPVAPLQAVTNTSLLLLGSSGAVYDSAMLNDMETVGDAKVTTAVSKFGNSSLVFDGSGDYLDLPASTNVRQTGSWTLEMWVYRTSAVNCYVYSQVTTNFLQIAISPANYILVDRSGVGTAITSTNPMSLNTWTHIALVSDAVNLKLFVDGVQSGSTVAVGTQVQATTTPTRIGAYQGTGTLGFVGYIDDLRITSGYARYTQNFTVPTQPFPVQ